MAGAAWDAADNAGLKAAKDAGVNITMVNSDGKMAGEFRDLIKGMDQTWYDLVSKRGVDAKAALAEIREIARNYK